jgi:hemolysin III
MKPLFFRMREPFCGLSHFAGAGLSLVGLILCLALARGDFWLTFSFLVYGSSLIFLYLASAFYHSLPAPEKGAGWLQRLDHSAIYVLIAGSYTPICLVSLRGFWGWSLLAIIYGLALVGVGSSLFWKRAPRLLRIVLCISMGWMALAALGPLQRAFPGAALLWLVAGGVVYSIGTIIYSTNRPHLWPGRFSAHDLWHLFVLAGSACHFIFMYRFVLPVAT